MNWFKQLDTSDSEASIMAVTQEYAAEIPRWLRCFIPRECNQREIHRPADVLAWSAGLSQRFAGDEVAQHDLHVQELVVFFVKASSRLSDLKDRTSYAANFAHYERQRTLHGTEKA